MLPSQVISALLHIPVLCFALLRSLFSNIGLQVHRLSSVRPRYLQVNPNLCLPVFPTHEGKGMAFCPLEVCPYPHLHSMHPDLLSFLIISFYTVDQLLLRILIQCEYQTAPIPPNQSCLEYPARICLLYVLQSLLPTQPENYILQLIWKEMQ